MENTDDEKISFEEFEKKTKEEGHPLYKGIRPENLDNFRELFFHTVMAHICTLGFLDVKDARLPKKEWHKLYGQALMGNLKK